MHVVRTILTLFLMSGLAIASLAEVSAEEAKERSIADLVEVVEPSVVRIDVTLKTGGGVGSGFVVAADGIVVTNHHVIAGAHKAVVSFRDGKTAPVVGTLALDAKRDIAVLKIGAKNLPALKLAEKFPRKGESVVTFGAPRGLSFAATEGIVSAIRQGEELKNYIKDLPGTWIQTSAPISQGNSGGPLVNRQGEVVGANTMMLMRGQNLNFAISAKDIGEKLAEGLKSEVVALEKGAAKEIKSAKKGGRSNEISPQDISPANFDAFVDLGEQVRSVVVDELKKAVQIKRDKLKKLKAGRTDKRLKSRGKEFGIVKSKGISRYVYADAATKRNMVNRQRDSLKRAQDALGKYRKDEQGLYDFLLTAGPPLRPTTVGDVGYVRALRVAQIIDEQEFHSFLGKARVAVRGKATQFLASGSIVPMGLMFIAGTEKYQTTKGHSVTILVIRELPTEYLKTHMGIVDEPGDEVSDEKESSGSEGETAKETAAEEDADDKESSAAQPDKTAESGEDAAPAASAMRVWKDKSGKKRIEAEFVSMKEGKVKLRKASGSLITVPIERFSDEDREHLRELAEQESA